MNKSIMENFKNELKKAVSQHYKTLVARFPEEEFYGYSLYSDGDVSGMGPVSNRTSSLTVDKTDPMYIYCRYSPECKNFPSWKEYDKNIVELRLPH